eukprot:6203528-Pleurochrysis_carterae.AAC.1
MLRASIGRRLRPDFLRNHETHVNQSFAAIVDSAGMRTRRSDFVAAYLQGILEYNKVVYCHAPPGYALVGAEGRRTSHLPRRQSYLRHGTSWSLLATLAVSMAARIWLHAVPI